jgi:hypothetical protein
LALLNSRFLREKGGRHVARRSGRSVPNGEESR